jgi:hypothetical protein
MGLHLCEYCRCQGQPEYDCTSTGDTTMEFSSGNKYEVPDMILHYIADHGWVPPKEFIDDVMYSELVGGERWQTKSIQVTTKVGYLKGPDLEPITSGTVPEGFVEKLVILMRQADELGQRIQYRGN